MTVSQPYTREELKAVTQFHDIRADLAAQRARAAESPGEKSSEEYDAFMSLRTAATLRDYQRVLAEVAALREDARRWRAVREDLAVARESAIVGGVEYQYWRFVGNHYDLYPGPFPATLDEAADRLIAAAIEDQKFIDAAREGGEGEQ